MSVLPNAASVLCELHQFSVMLQSPTDWGEEVGGQVEELAQEGVPVEEEAAVQLGRRRVGGWLGARAGQVCSWWPEEEPGWEMDCRGEE